MDKLRTEIRNALVNTGFVDIENGDEGNTIYGREAEPTSEDAGDGFALTIDLM
jgi:hypothetical protein